MMQVNPLAPQTAAPTFSQPAGTYAGAQTVTISDATSSANIYYTTDGSTPTLNSTYYSGPIPVSVSETLEAIAAAPGETSSAVASATYTINIRQAATPTFSVPAGTYTSAQTVTISDTTPNAVLYYTTNGTTPNTSSAVYSGAISISSSETLEAIATGPGDTTSSAAIAAYTIDIPPNPAPAISGMSPGFTTAGGAGFPLTIAGTGFDTASTAYWGANALSTTYVSATQLTAQVPAAEIASGGITNISVRSPTPGGGTSNSLQFEVDAAGSTSAAPTFTTLTASMAAGSSATYSVTLPSSASSVSVTCLNLPTGATCSYSSTTNVVTIATGATTPAGTYQVTVVFTETLPGAASGFILLPFLLLPLFYLRRKLAARGVWIPACLGLVLMAAVAVASVGCGGGGGATTSTPPVNPTHQVTSSGTVSLTIH